MAEEREIDTTRIIRSPEILAGEPVVRGTRIPVALVIEYLANNPNFSNLFADHPHLTMDDVKACLSFAQAAVESITTRRMWSRKRIGS